MRRLTLPLCALVLLAAFPALVVAEDPPATEPALEQPSEAWSRINTEARTLPYAQRRPAIKQGAETYLAKWKASGQVPDATQLLSLGHMLRTAERWSEAAGAFMLITISEGTSPDLVDAAASAEASLYASSTVREALGTEHTAKALKRLLAHASGMTGERQQSTRGSMQVTLANILAAVDRKGEAHDLRVSVATRDPSMVGRVYRSLVWGMLDGVHDMDAYDALRKRAEPVLALLAAQQGKAVAQADAKVETAKQTLLESKPEALDEEGNLVEKARAKWSKLEQAYSNLQRQASSARSILTRVEKAGQPFEMLGKPAPAWTLEHAFGDVKSLEDVKGKVVVLDFWATWCPWCIRSFPAIRDVLKTYGEQGLTFVGVTASAGSVYAARYDLDDDLKDKFDPEVGARAAARLARGSQQPDGETIFDAESYRAKEREVITEFIANHEMTWPVVMIDKSEPGPKYALGGWPHAVILDRQGRVRYFKSGALLRDRPEAMAAFQKVVADLLAEGAAKPGE